MLLLIAQAKGAVKHDHDRPHGDENLTITFGYEVQITKP